MIAYLKSESEFLYSPNVGLTQEFDLMTQCSEK